MKTKTPNIPVTLGQTIWNCGHEFIVIDIWTEEVAKGILFRYRGICTSSAVNDSIRHLGYNGGVYGGFCQ